MNGANLNNNNPFRIGLALLSSYKKWAGGVIYILNIINALKTLPEAKQPELLVYYVEDAPIKDVLAINYNKLILIPIPSNYSIIKKILHNIYVRIFKRSFIFSKLPDIVYPYTNWLPVGKPVHWIPDLQEHFYPDFFSKRDINARKINQKIISSFKNSTIVFSSKTSLEDFKRIYPKNKATLRVLHFYSALPSYKVFDFKYIQNKYDLKGKYFMCPNQFWKHKNHKVILEALNYLKSKDLDFEIVFTGVKEDLRDSEYFRSLLIYISENELNRWIKFLGFISREEQLVLMDNAVAIIQPSLFEGWSTVVEDSKALNQLIILSNIKVHNEQISNNCIFFDPLNSKNLSELILKLIIEPSNRRVYEYDKNVKNFGVEIINLFKKISNKN